MKTLLLLLGTDQLSYPLLRFLASEGKSCGWKTIVASLFDYTILERLRKEEFASALTLVNITQFKQCDRSIQKSDLVVALVPEVTLLKVADSCIFHGKSLITPTRLNRQMAQRKSHAEENNSLILMECGFSPGLDHITSKKAIDTIHAKGGKISSFKTYNASLIQDSDVDNPWRFKLTEPADELINFGKHNNRHLINGQLQHIPYHHLFARSEPVRFDGLGDTIMVPEGDSLYYRQLYGLKEAHTVVKGKVFKKGFDDIWNLIINLGLTNTTSRVDFLGERSFYSFLKSLLPVSHCNLPETALYRFYQASDEGIEKLRWLGLFDQRWMKTRSRELTAAAILKNLLEQKFLPQSDDRDFILMEHRLKYVHHNAHHSFKATLIASGEYPNNSALSNVMAVTIGAAIKAFFRGTIVSKGVCIPILKEIYDPILNELDDLGVAFQVEEKRVWTNEVHAESQGDN